MYISIQQSILCLMGEKGQEIYNITVHPTLDIVIKTWLIVSLIE